MRVKKGDTVKVMKGKDAGKQGTVIKVHPVDMMIVVEGVNIFKKHIKGDGQNKESSIVDVIKPIPVSNVRVICKLCSKPVRIGYQLIDGKKERVCKKCGKLIDGSVDAKAKSTGTKKTAKTAKKTVTKTVIKKEKKTVSKTSKKVKKSTSKK